MENNTNNLSLDDEEVNIREPDPSYLEQIMEDEYPTAIDKELNDAIYLSLDSWREEQIQNQKFEEELINYFENEKKKRTQYFEKLLFDLQKIKKYDNEIREIYEIIEPIITSYCDQFFNTCTIDCCTYSKIFRLLETIRTDKNAISVLKTIIISE